jgi:FSR family fosmidomycin resistance protein-like MFS transporter
MFWVAAIRSDSGAASMFSRRVIMSANAEVPIGGKAPVVGSSSVARQPARQPSVARSEVAAVTQDVAGPVHAILWIMCFAHFLNDLLQSLLSAVFPMLRDAYHLDFSQIGYIALAFQITASILQPLVGMYTDKRPTPWGLAAGMGATLVGLLFLAYAGSYWGLLLAASMVGIGSSIFHPEGSRVVRMAAGGRMGTAQSTFQVGGNFGQASGPLLAAFVLIPLGQRGLVWFALVALLAMALLVWVGRWYAATVAREARAPRRAAVGGGHGLTRNQIGITIGLLLLLMFSKSFYSSSLTTFYTFYLMDKFQVPLRDAQLYLFLFMGSVAAGVYFGGPLGDKFGRKYIIWFSILGALPFTLALPYANLFWAAILTVAIGFITASSMSQIVVYALELVPGRTGMLSGLFLGFAFGMSGVAAAALGHLADVTSLDLVFKICSFLPLIGAVCWFLPNIDKQRK